MKLIKNYSNNKPHNPQGFKEQVKIKYDTIKAITGKFPNEIAAMMALLRATTSVIDWAGYCMVTPAKQLMWKKRGDKLNKALLYYLMNSKNKHVKKDLNLAYSQGNTTVYIPIIKGIASRYLLTQYPNNKPAHQRNGKKGDTKKEDYRKSNDKDNNTGGTVGAHVEDTVDIQITALLVTL